MKNYGCFINRIRAVPDGKSNHIIDTSALQQTILFAIITQCGYPAVGRQVCRGVIINLDKWRYPDG